MYVTSIKMRIQKTLFCKKASHLNFQSTYNTAYMGIFTQGEGTPTEVSA